MAALLVGGGGGGGVVEWQHSNASQPGDRADLVSPWVHHNKTTSCSCCLAPNCCKEKSAANLDRRSSAGRAEMRALWPVATRQPLGARVQKVGARASEKLKGKERERARENDGEPHFFSFHARAKCAPANAAQQWQFVRAHLYEQRICANLAKIGILYEQQVAAERHKNKTKQKQLAPGKTRLAPGRVTHLFESNKEEVAAKSGKN